MAHASGRVRADNVTARVDTVGLGRGGTRDVKRGERGAIFHKTMVPRAIIERARNVAAIVDPTDVGQYSAGDIDGG